MPLEPVPYLQCDECGNTLGMSALITDVVEGSKGPVTLKSQATALCCNREMRQHLCVTGTMIPVEALRLGGYGGSI